MFNSELNFGYYQGGVGKSQLAKAYSTELSYDSARKRLISWMDRHPTLMKRLEATGYRRNSRVFTPAQVKIIFDCLGEP